MAFLNYTCFTRIFPLIIQKRLNSEPFYWLSLTPISMVLCKICSCLLRKQRQNKILDKLYKGHNAINIPPLP